MTRNLPPTARPTFGGKRLIILCLVLLLVATIYFGTDAKRFGSEAGVPADAAGQVVLLQLTAEHCPSCRDMEPVMDALRQVYGERARFHEIDVFQHSGTASAYGIQTIPAYVFYDRQGRERYRHEGMLDQSTMAEWLEELLAEPERGAVSG